MYDVLNLMPIMSSAYSMLILSHIFWLSSFFLLPCCCWTFLLNFFHSFVNTCFTPSTSCLYINTQMLPIMLEFFCLTFPVISVIPHFAPNSIQNLPYTHTQFNPFPLQLSFSSTHCCSPSLRLDITKQKPHSLCLHSITPCCSLTSPWVLSLP